MKHYAVAVIGGGISGLACAQRLQEQGIQEVGLLEAQNRLGGVIETVQKGGFTVEAGPDCFISDKPGFDQWGSKSGVSNDFIGTQSAYRRSLIYNSGKLSPIPDGFYLISPTTAKSLLQLPGVSLGGKLRMAMEPFVPPRRAAEDESVAGFIRRRLGQEALVKIGQPMIGGIYTADPEQLSVQAAMPRFREMELEHGSLARALFARKKKEAERSASGPRYSLFLSMKNGMEEMVRLLRANLKSVDIRSGFKIKTLRKGEIWTLVSEQGETVTADCVCLAVPAYEAGRLLRHDEPGLAALLDSIPYESAATVNLAYSDKNIPQIPRAFGFVVPAEEKRKIVGCTFAGLKFEGRAPEGKTLLRVFLGGAFHHGLPELEDPELKKIAMHEVEHMLGIKAEPEICLVRRLLKAMPQYHVGHLGKVESIFKKAAAIPGLYLTGNAYRGVGIPDCILHAEKTADMILAAWRERN